MEAPGDLALLKSRLADGLLTTSLGTMMLVKIYKKNKIVQLDGADSMGTKMSQRSIQRLDGPPSNHQ